MSTKRKDYAWYRVQCDGLAYYVDFESDTAKSKRPKEFEDTYDPSEEENRDSLTLSSSVGTESDEQQTTFETKDFVAELRAADYAKRKSVIMLKVPTLAERDDWCDSLAEIVGKAVKESDAEFRHMLFKAAYGYVAKRSEPLDKKYDGIKTGLVALLSTMKGVSTDDTAALCIKVLERVAKSSTEILAIALGFFSAENPKTRKAASNLFTRFGKRDKNTPQLIQHFYDYVNAQDWQNLSKILTEDFKWRGDCSIHSNLAGWTELEKTLQSYSKAIPDLKYTIKRDPEYSGCQVLVQGSIKGTPTDALPIALPSQTVGQFQTRFVHVFYVYRDKIAYMVNMTDSTSFFSSTGRGVTALTKHFKVEALADHIVKVRDESMVTGRAIELLITDSKSVPWEPKVVICSSGKVQIKYANGAVCYTNCGASNKGLIMATPNGVAIVTDKNGVAEFVLNFNVVRVKQDSIPCRFVFRFASDETIVLEHEVIVSKARFSTSKKLKSEGNLLLPNGKSVKKGPQTSRESSSKKKKRVKSERPEKPKAVRTKSKEHLASGEKVTDLRIRSRSESPTATALRSSKKNKRAPLSMFKREKRIGSPPRVRSGGRVNKDSNGSGQKDTKIKPLPFGRRPSKFASYSIVHASSFEELPDDFKNVINKAKIAVYKCNEHMEVLLHCLRFDTKVSFRLNKDEPSDNYRKDGRPYASEEMVALAKAALVEPEKEIKKLYKGMLECGKGGFGRVYVAKDYATKSKVAIKKLPHSMASEMKHNFYEIAFLSQCSNKNIVKYIKSMLVSDEIWIVTEYLQGGTLADALRLGTRFSDKHVAYIAREVLRALKYLHNTKGWVHRDLKTSNIMLSTSGMVKLIDFGLCADISDGKKRVQMLGTPFYMPPEMIINAPHGFPADIWSLGVCLLSIVLGKTPNNESRLKAMFIIGTDGLISHIPTTISPNAKDFIKKCLTWEQEKRPNAETLLKHDYLNQPKMERGITGLLKSIFMTTSIQELGL